MLQAQAKVSAAQEALTASQKAYEDAVAQKYTLDLIVLDNLQTLNNAIQDKQVKQQAVLDAQEALDAAQLQYETALIPDPFWIHPTQQVPYTREVAYTEIVLNTILVPRTTTTVVGGVTADVFNRRGYNSAPPIPSSSESPVYATTVSNIDFQWGGGQVLNSGYAEDVIVRFTGNLMVPVDAYYYFYTPADDGTKLNIAGMSLIDDWYDKGGGGSTSQAVWIRAGILYPFTLHYYENGGGAAVSFMYSTGGGYQVIPSSWLGNTVITETTYEEVMVYEEVTRYRTETYYVEELVPGVSAPLVNNPLLQVVVNQKQDSLTTAQTDLESAMSEQAISQEIYDTSANAQSEKAGIIVIASNDVINKQENVYIAQQELEAIPPFREPTPTPEETKEPIEKPTEVIIEPIPEPNTPTPTETPELPVNIDTVDPQELTPAEVTELISVANEILASSEQGSPEYEQALEALFVAAEADDIQLDAALAVIPGLSAAVDAINFMGNVGSDMSPKVREQSEKVVIASVVAVGSAVNAATAAAAMSASAPSGGTSNIRRNT